MIQKDKTHLIDPWWRHVELGFLGIIGKSTVESPYDIQKSYDLGDTHNNRTIDISR